MKSIVNAKDLKILICTLPNKIPRDAFDDIKIVRIIDYTDKEG